MEKRILQLWKESDVFRKSLEQRSGGPLFQLYDGPPTANASPGIHHVLARVFKDIIPRHRTMKGYYAPRKAGWDTHGLPVELEVENELGLKNKRDIESYGVARFNTHCKESVLRYLKEWEALTDRIGFWIDMDDPYITFQNSYIETCWWILKQYWDRGLVYQGYKVTPHCPRCETSLSSHEVALGYREDTPDPSVYIKFHLAPRLPHDPSARPDVYRRLCYVGDEPAYFLAWTTTPWTLPGNSALAVAPGAQYVVVQQETPDRRKETLVLAEALVSRVLTDGYEVLHTVQGEELVGLEYEPLFRPSDFRVDAERLSKEPHEKALGVPGGPLEYYPIIGADFVSMEEGTGIVHIAPAFGQVDYEAGLAHKLYLVQPVDLQGRIIGNYPFEGMFVKDADPLIIKDLKSRGLVYRAETIRHTYPFCWRCASPLLYYAKNSWYIKTTAAKEELLSANEEITWYPEHIKHGRFGDWLRNNVDWAFSRERYWGTPLPIWRCDGCGYVHCVGSAKELEDMAHREEMARSGRSLDECLKDFHRPFVDDIVLKCPARPDSRHLPDTMRRVPEVLDCWFDSGAMPFAQYHYPFENEALLSDGRFPATYICEAVDQTRGWFYSLHAIAVLLASSPAYRNVICLGHILDAQGDKMSKSKGNVVEPWAILNTSGADALRWYLFTACPPGNVRRFSGALVEEVLRKFLLTVWNTYSFFVTYANIDRFDPRAAEGLTYRAELDRWVISELNRLVMDVDRLLEQYDPTSAGRRIEAFVDDLSNWYVRRSRRRFWKSESDADKLAAHVTLYQCLVTLSKMLAPFTPFLAEELYQNLVRSVYPEAPESVHLADFPTPDPAQMDEGLAADTRLVIRVSSLGRSARAKAGVKVRQPLAGVAVRARTPQERQSLQRLAPQLLEELNVKNLAFAEQRELVEFKVRPSLPLLGPKYGKQVSALVAGLSRLDPNEVALHVQGGMEVAVGEWRLLPEEVLVDAEEKPGYSVATEGGLMVGVTTAITDDLAAEGLARELVHRLQTMRRLAGFDIADYIETHYQGGPGMQRVVEQFAAYIKQETLSRTLAEGEPPPGSYQETHRLDGQEVRLAVRRS